MADIMPPQTPEASPPAQTSFADPIGPTVLGISDALYIARMSRSDGCERCVDNYEVPRGVWAGEQPDSFVALYRCHVCGHVWRCGWSDR